MNATTATFRWTEKYSVNVAALDNQHKRLFATINELNQALASGEGKAVTEPVLQKLVDYAMSHFAAEEALLAEHGYPATASHRAGKPGVPVSLILFLQTWLKEHILVTDKAYTNFLNSRGVR